MILIWYQGNSISYNFYYCLFLFIHLSCIFDKIYKLKIFLIFKTLLNSEFKVTEVAIKNNVKLYFKVCNKNWRYTIDYENILNNLHIHSCQKLWSET